MWSVCYVARIIGHRSGNLPRGERPDARQNGTSFLSSETATARSLAREREREVKAASAPLLRLTVIEQNVAEHALAYLSSAVSLVLQSQAPIVHLRPRRIKH